MFEAVCNKNAIFLKNLIDTVSLVSMSESIDGSSNFIRLMMLRIDQDGIDIYSEHNRRVTAFARLFKNFFSEYKFESEIPICIGLTLDVMKTCFKYIVRNDEIRIEIPVEEDSLFPSIINFKVNDSKGFSVKFNMVQNLCNEDSEDFEDLIHVPSNRISNIYKELGGGKKSVELDMKDERMMLSSNMVDIANSWVMFKTPGWHRVGKSETRAEYFRIASKIASYDENCKVLMARERFDMRFSSNIVNAKESKRIVLGIINITISIDN